MPITQQISGIYLELVKRPYYFVVHSKLSASNERYDRYFPRMLREFMKSPQHRRYVAKERDVLYITNPHLEKNAVEFRGYWVGTNVGHVQVSSVARMACEAANVPCLSIRKLRSFAGNA